jgi:ubiquinone/menaquinone biosynthesis C-methylase UbiE
MLYEGNVPTMIANNRWNRWRYTLWAPIYDFLLAKKLHHKRRISIRLANIKKDEKVLLVGAGTGLDLPYLPQDCQITAIDITPAMIVHLNHRANQLGVDVESHVMDAQKLLFPDKSFDVVVLHLILAVIPDPLVCMAEVVRVLKPNGRIVVFDKFLPKGSLSLILRLFNPLTKILATNITRRLEFIIQPFGLHIVRDKSTGVLRTVLLQKSLLEE